MQRHPVSNLIYRSRDPPERQFQQRECRCDRGGTAYLAMRFATMKSWTMLLAMPLLTPHPTSIDAMKWERRVLLVSAPAIGDPALGMQRRIIEHWQTEAEARDVSFVEMTGETVAGATDTAAVLRRKYHLPSTRFTAIVIGKDGDEKLRRARPISAAELEATIDAMPMRKAGER